MRHLRAHGSSPLGGLFRRYKLMMSEGGGLIT
jgi:hypothetical protein